MEAVELIYARALSFYDNVFPEDEVGFRQTLVNRYNKQLGLAMKQRGKLATGSESNG